MQQLLSKSLAEEIKLAAKLKAAALIDSGIDPQLGVILVGSHPDSLRYIAIKTRVAKEVGVIVSLYHLEETASYEEVEESIRFLNEDSDIHGIIIQLPLPDQFSQEQTDKLLKLVKPEKDVDGLAGAWQKENFTATTIKDLLQYSGIIPPMVSAVVSLLNHYQIDFLTKKIAIVGKGRLVGGPLEHYFQKVGADATAVDEETNDILDITKQADILISGTGENDLITYQWVKEGAVVIDCAEDIHEDSVTQVASALAPSKGGVGPLTVLWLLHNTLQMAVTNGGTHV